MQYKCATRHQDHARKKCVRTLSSLLRVVVTWSILAVGEGEVSDDHETVPPVVVPVAHPPCVHHCARRTSLLRPLLRPSLRPLCARHRVCRHIHHQRVSNLRNGRLGLQFTPIGSRFAATAGVHQPNDDKWRSGGVTLVTSSGECVLSSQRMDRRGAVSWYGIACVHAEGDRVICSPNLFREGGEGNIRTPNPKGETGEEGTHPLEATEGGTCQDSKRRDQAKDTNWGETS